jgi:sulfur carrier protein ThiS adenylyltransferase
MNELVNDLKKRLGGAAYDKISAAKIGIAGCGGLGSNCAHYLVRSGFSLFVLVDFDVVEYSNLNRQFYFQDQVGISKVEGLSVNLKRINPDILLETKRCRVDRSNVLDLFLGCDVVVEAFDGAGDKKMLAEELVGKAPFYVSASGLCGWGNADNIVTRTVRPDFALIGDGVTDCSQVSPLAPRVNIAAAKQADAVMSFVLGGSCK